MSGYDISIPPRNQRGLQETRRFGVSSSTASFNLTPLSARIAVTTPHVVANGFDMFQSHPTFSGDYDKMTNRYDMCYGFFQSYPEERGEGIAAYEPALESNYLQSYPDRAGISLTTCWGLLR
jgi:hypothetical protein